jgi:hypothetical protein
MLHEEFLSHIRGILKKINLYDKSPPFCSNRYVTLHCCQFLSEYVSFPLIMIPPVL